MKKLTLFFLFVCVSMSVNAQDTLRSRAKNSFFIEFGGNAAGIIQHLPEDFSLNYERILHNGSLVRTSIRIGSNIPRFGSHPGGYIRRTHVIPVMFNVLVGKKEFSFECDAGIAFIYVNADYKVVYSAFAGVIGLRYQNKKTGLIVRGGFTPTLGVVKSDIYLGAPAGISVGDSF